MNGMVPLPPPLFLRSRSRTKRLTSRREIRPMPSRSTVLKSNSKSTFTVPVPVLVPPPPLLVLPIFLVFLVVVELAGAK